MTAQPTDWNPETYARFRGLRLRPALDLLAQVPALPPGPVIDLGCGNGAVGPALASRWPDRPVIGLDSSPAMLAHAAETGAYAGLVEADAARWQPEEAPALIFSNAALHWLGDHETLLPRLAGLLAPGGSLAVQMPRQWTQPSHRFMRDIAVSMMPATFDFTDYEPPVQSAESYLRMLLPLGEVLAWESEFIQRLAPADSGHPVRRFTESTGMRPFLERMTAAQQEAFLAAYDEAVGVAYPVLPDGSALFPFRRAFFVLTLPGGGA